MSSMNPNANSFKSKASYKNTAYYLKKLCLKLNNNDRDKVEDLYSEAVSLINVFAEEEFHTTLSPWEETCISDRIVNRLKLLHPNNRRVLERFNTLNRALKQNRKYKYPQNVLFLLKLSESTSVSSAIENDNYSLPQNTLESTVASNDLSTFDLISSSQMSFFQPTEGGTHASEGPSSLMKSSLKLAEEQIDSPLKTNFNVDHLYTNTPPTAKPCAASSQNGSSSRRPADASKLQEISISDSESNRLAFESHDSHFVIKDKIETSEYQIMKELVYCMSGHEGEIIKRKTADDGFYIPVAIQINKRSIVEHLMELGYLSTRVKSMLAVNLDKGIINNALISAVRLQHNEYFTLVSELSTQLELDPKLCRTGLTDRDFATYHIPTLLSLSVWSREPFLLLQTLHDILLALKDKRGGQIISTLTFARKNGNSRVQEIVGHLLSNSLRPFYRQIFEWVLNGTFTDIHQEFFVVHDPTKKSWDTQFTLRQSMIPNFMTADEINYILEAGRCMNFLQSMCQERPQKTKAQLDLQLREEKLFKKDEPCLLEVASEISTLIHDIYIDVSKTVLQTLTVNFKMQIHLEALRKYILLGQGDFAHHLLEILEPDLNKAVASASSMPLMQSVSEAYDKSVAQFDDSDVFKNLCIKQLDTTDKESISETFCLQYRLEGPLNMVFKSSFVVYNRLFTFIWRVKRANHMVLKMWRGMTLLFRDIDKILTEAKQTFVLGNMFIMEMVNFIGHFHYYISAEAIDASWLKFRTSLAHVESLENLMQSHSLFLKHVQVCCLLISTEEKNAKSVAEMAAMVRTVLDFVPELLPIVELFQSICEAELQRRKQRQIMIDRCGTSYAEEDADQHARRLFCEELNKIKIKFKVSSTQYQEKLKQLLLLFAKNQDLQELFLLSHHIDFNEFYKNSDARLSDSLRN